MLNLRKISVSSVLCLIAALEPLAASAQNVGARNPGAQSSGSAAGSVQPPIAYTSVSELNGILTQLQQTAKNMQSDLGKMHIEKWKTDAATKRQTLATVESIQRNLQSALPDTIAQLNSSPEDLDASFKLYRNLVLLYDYFGAVVENAGAFGSKDELQSLSNDMSGLEAERREFGERMQKLAASKEDELTHLRAQVKTLAAAVAAAPQPPPKKVVVDDTAPPPKPAKKKVTKPKPPATTTTAPPTPTTTSAPPQ